MRCLQPMRLQRVQSRKVGDRTYHKFVLTLPEEIVSAAGWEAGAEVSARVKGQKVVLSYAGTTGPAPRKAKKTDYEEFREAIRSELASNPDGLRWSELRTRLQLDQKVPNNIWVRRLERDIRLLRVKDVIGTRWRLA